MDLNKLQSERQAWLDAIKAKKTTVKEGMAAVRELESLIVKAGGEVPYRPWYSGFAEGVSDVGVQLAGLGMRGGRAMFSNQEDKSQDWFERQVSGLGQYQDKLARNYAAEGPPEGMDWWRLGGNIGGGAAMSVPAALLAATGAAPILGTGAAAMVGATIGGMAGGDADIDNEGEGLDSYWTTKGLEGLAGLATLGLVKGGSAAVKPLARTSWAGRKLSRAMPKRGQKWVNELGETQDVATAEAAAETRRYAHGLGVEPADLKVDYSVDLPKAADQLVKEGWTPTLGQRMQAEGHPGARAFEETWTSMPGVGSAIEEAEKQSLRSWNRVVVNRAIKLLPKEHQDLFRPLRPGDKTSAQEMVAHLDAVLSKAYDDLIPDIKFKLDDKVAAAFQDIQDFARIAESGVGEVKPAQQAFEDAMAWMRQEKFGLNLNANRAGAHPNAVSLSGEAWQRIVSEFKRRGREAARHGLDTPGYGDAATVWSELVEALQDAAIRHSPREVGAKLRPVNTAYRMSLPILHVTEAGTRADAAGLFTPSDLARSTVRRLVRNPRDKKMGAQGRYPWAQTIFDARAVGVPSTVPNSGTANRLQHSSLPAIAAGFAARPVYNAASGQGGPVGGAMREVVAPALAGAGGVTGSGGVGATGGSTASGLLDLGDPQY